MPAWYERRHIHGRASFAALFAGISRLPIAYEWKESMAACRGAGIFTKPILAGASRLSA